MHAKLQVSAGQFSDPGKKPVNQDFHGMMLPNDQLIKTKGIAIAIADGISSSEYGQGASEACVTGLLEDYFSTPETWSVKKSAQQVLAALNSWLYAHGQSSRDPNRGWVSTLSALILKSTTAHLVHVGDSRVYLLRDGILEQLTTDHKTWVSKEKNYLSRAMGADVYVEIDYRKLSLNKGDVFVLTTDGVHEYVTDKDITRMVMNNRDNLERAAEVVVQAALTNDSPDNVTCQVLSADELPSQDPDDVFQALTELPFPPELSEGMIIDGYRIVREIHASNRTQLYLALDTETDLHVALKTPSVNYEDDPAYIDRFILEEWIGRRLDSPHVVKVYEPTRRRRFLYHVTEYLEGGTLRQWMHDHPLPGLEEVRGIVEQIAKGLRAFHRMEMVHQDLKPENVMIDKAGTVKLVDFGSTKVAGIAEIETPIERVNMLGTKNYMAPEYRSNQPGTNRSDIYSLGVITYEMLTGKLPYGELPAKWAAKDATKKLRYRSTAEHYPSIQKWVDGSIEKAVEPQPTDRYGALSEFLHDLRYPNPENVRDGQPPLMQRNPLVFWQGLCGFLVLIIVYLLYRISI